MLTHADTNDWQRTPPQGKTLTDTEVCKSGPNVPMIGRILHNQGTSLQLGAKR